MLFLPFKNSAPKKNSKQNIKVRLTCKGSSIYDIYVMYAKMSVNICYCDPPDFQSFHMFRIDTGCGLQKIFTRALHRK